MVIIAIFVVSFNSYNIVNGYGWIWIKLDFTEIKIPSNKNKIFSFSVFLSTIYQTFIINHYFWLNTIVQNGKITNILYYLNNSSNNVCTHNIMEISIKI